jgi:thioredoxin reductase (NADPH)
MKESKVVIIGSGVAGLSCALYLARAGVAFYLLEKGAPGGKLLTVAEISNYPGFHKISGMDLAMAFLNSATSQGVEVTYGNVLSVEKIEKGFRLHCEDETYECEAVVVASGLTNAPSFPGEKALLGKGVSYCATCDGPLYKKKDVAVFGKGEKALEEALYLAGLAHHVYLLTPEEHYDASESLLASLKEKGTAEILTSCTILSLKGESHLESVLIKEQGKEKEIALSAFFPLTGEKSAAGFLSSLPLSLNHGFIPVDANQMSAVPGLFAIGDIVDKKLRQVVTAAGDGANASSGVIAYLRGKGQRHG